MSAPPTDAPTREPRPERDDEPDRLGPPESTFWQQYNAAPRVPDLDVISVLFTS